VSDRVTLTEVARQQTTLSGPSVSVDDGALSAAHSKGRVAGRWMAAQSWGSMENDPQ
jgi:hypothetical protein